MATILEGLNKLSGALGGAETATENLDALNAISAALGGSADAENNADAIDQIAEHASGCGGGFTSVEVQINSTVDEAYNVSFNGTDEDPDGYNYITALLQADGRHYSAWDYEGPIATTATIIKLAESFEFMTLKPMTATGDAVVREEHDPGGTLYVATITGNCALTITN